MRHRKGNGEDQQLESPLNTPKFKSDLDRQARVALSKGGGRKLARQEAFKESQTKAEKASYRLNRKHKF